MFSSDSRARSAAADIFALVVYSFIVGMAIEVFLSGMSFSQSLSSRLLSIPVNILIAWPYGIYRDWFIRQSQRCSPTGTAKSWPICLPMSLFSRRYTPLFCGLWVPTVRKLSRRSPVTPWYRWQWASPTAIFRLLPQVV